MTKLCRALFECEKKRKLVEKINAQLCSALKRERVCKKWMSWDGTSLYWYETGKNIPSLIILWGSNKIHCQCIHWANHWIFGGGLHIPMCAMKHSLLIFIAM